MSGVLSLLVAGSAGLRVTAPDLYGGAAAGTQASGSSTATVTGGSGSYSHSWVKASGLTGSTLSGANTATVTATRTLTNVGQDSGTLTDTVTDTVTGATATVTINALLENA